MLGRLGVIALAKRYSAGSENVQSQVRYRLLPVELSYGHCFKARKSILPRGVMLTLDRTGACQGGKVLREEDNYIVPSVLDMFSFSVVDDSSKISGTTTTTTTTRVIIIRN